ncbi:Gfo/Idh/MocA family oxidoreductase [Sphingomonas sp. LB-2]|uniref:Gfo/Idh/MocA family protein n=1 Tax=Sphingomonas caeni TaxID=2984949 RepID=UPI00222FFBEB|nr:Gfo/Idh/MocA family oxidoreductase [Sphingomonas caeni]MCW3846461.1 Gfo/Idh/MocA family oxidoreductase [Sphingomonas caeni]
MADSSKLSRRALIELAAGATVATAASAKAASNAKGEPPLPDDQKLGVAIVGIGKLSQGQLIPGLRNTKGVKLAALVSGHPEKAAEWAKKEGLSPDAIYTYENYDRIANDPRIDIVYIVLPNSMHAEYTIRALKAGKHVLCEKPMAVSVAECEAMIAAAKAAKRHLMIAYRCHYEPHNLEGMRRIRSGKYGKPRLVVTEMGRQSSLSDPADVWRLDMKMSGGGALTDMGIYGINGTRYLLGEEPTQVRAWANTDHSDPRFKDVEDLISWQFKFPSGALAHGSTSFSYAGCMKWDVFCEKARIRSDPGAYYGGIQLDIFSHPDQGTVKIADIDQFAREMDWMGDVVRGKVPMVSPGEEGLQDVRLMTAIMESVAKGGATVKTDFGYKRAVDPAAVVDVPVSG